MSTRGAARPMMLSSFAFAAMTAFVKLAGERLPSQELVTARAALTLLFTYLMLRRARVPMLGRRRGLLFLRGLCGFTAMSSVYYAVTKLPLAEATVIQYLSPSLTALLGLLLLGERPGRKIALRASLGLAGVMCIARPSFLFGQAASPLDTWGVLAALSGALFTSCAYVIVRTLGRTEDPLVIVFYFPLVALPASIPAMAPSALWPTPREWILLLLIGISTQIGQLAVTEGLQREEAGSAAIYSYLQVVFATLFGVLVFGNVPGPWTAVGALLILGSAALQEQRGATAAQKR